MGSEAQTREAVQREAARTAEHARTAAAEVAETAKEQARQVTREAGEHARPGGELRTDHLITHLPPWKTLRTGTTFSSTERADAYARCSSPATDRTH